MEQVRAIYLDPYLSPSNKKGRKVEDSSPNEIQKERKQLLEAFFVGDKKEVDDVIKNNYLQSRSVDNIEDWENLKSEHYMAFNTESFGDEENSTKKEEWRVEFRAVKMPKNYQILPWQIELVVKILEHIKV